MGECLLKGAVFQMSTMEKHLLITWVRIEKKDCLPACIPTWVWSQSFIQNSNKQENILVEDETGYDIKANNLLPWWRECREQFKVLTLSWRRLLSYRNQSIDFQSKSLDWFLYDNGLHHEIVKG